MGVHYFYTWVTRRYPLFKKSYDPEAIPGVDNFFLDLNGVLYRCARDDKALYRDMLKGKSMDEIFASIFNYINFLVNHMRPKKRLFIAIDGVAPRAKMNNQRQRRYHSAKSNKSLNEFLTEQLDTDPGVMAFKNNSISPGTEFMMELIDKIKFFVQRKIHEDDQWKNIDVIVSGGDVPGEGEHKIMDWLRGWKQSKDFNINESHCIYSMDADLIFLSLSMHLPKMMILRETMTYSKNHVNSATKRSTEEQQLEILFINLLREYMELEYKKDADKYTHEFDIERIIDDFILIAFFIGNDFLHQLYCMSTKKGNFDEIIEIFKSTLPTLGGYLSHHGEITWPNFAEFLKKIIKLENKMIESTLELMKDYLSETKQNKQSLFVDEEEADQYDEPADEDEEEYAAIKKKHKKSEFEEDDDPDDSNNVDDLTKQYEESPSNETFANPDETFFDKRNESPSMKKDETDLKILDKNYELEYQLYYKKIKTEVEFISDIVAGLKSNNHAEIAAKKLKFYIKFFNIKSMDDLDKICFDYIKGLQFVMYYYFHGCPSWTWYYPYFMSPFLSDLITVVAANANKIKNIFEEAEPYKPFDQLAYILPRASLGLLPKIYEEKLLGDERTARYYPKQLTDFEPFDGIHDYQWIAKLELFNDKEMKEVLENIDLDSLAIEELRRNCRGTEEIYSYDREAKYIKVKSLVSGLPDFEEKIKIKKMNLKNMYPFDPKLVDYESVSKVDIDCGFPSLRFIKGVEATLQEVNKKAKYKRLILKLQPDLVNPERQYGGYKGYVFYDYPFKKIGYINTAVEAGGFYPMGNLNSREVEDIIEEKRLSPSRPYDVYRTVANECTKNLYHEKGIDFIAKGDRETFYELEKRKSAWRTALDPSGKIIYEFDYVRDLYPHGLLMPFNLEESDKLVKQFHYPTKESELFAYGTDCVSLYNGDLFTISKKPPTDTSVFGNVYKPNHNQSKEVFNGSELLEEDWRLINESVLKELGLEYNQAFVLYHLIDSCIIRTDASKTSSLILGQLFDIGLRFVKFIGQPESRFMVVTDLVKMLRARQGSDTALPVKKGGDYIYYDLYISPKGLSVVKEFFAKFPEIVNFMKDVAKKSDYRLDKLTSKTSLKKTVIHDVDCLLTLDKEDISFSYY